MKYWHHLLTYTHVYVIFYNPYIISPIKKKVGSHAHCLILLYLFQDLASNTKRSGNIWQLNYYQACPKTRVHFFIESDFTTMSNTYYIFESYSKKHRIHSTHSYFKLDALRLILQVFFFEFAGPFELGLCDNYIGWFPFFFISRKKRGKYN